MRPRTLLCTPNGKATFLSQRGLYLSGDDLLSHTRVARAPSPARPAPRQDSILPKAFASPCSHVTDKDQGAGYAAGRKAAGSGRPTLSAGMSTSQTLAKYRYQRRLPHLQKADAALFVTFCTGGRMILPGRARDLVLAHCLREAGILPVAGEGARPTPAPRIRLHAVMVMPDHVHLLLTPLRDKDGWPFPLVDILQCLKSSTAHRINRAFGISGPVWEEESFDHVLRSDQSLKEKCEYIVCFRQACGTLVQERAANSGFKDDER